MLRKILEQMDKITGKDSAAVVGGVFGFETLGEFFKSLFGIQYALLVTPASILAGASYFITKFIWDSEEAIYTLFALMLADWITGIAKAIKRKSFENHKVLQIPIKAIATMFLIGISWNMAKSNALLAPLPSVVYIGFTLVYFISIVKNLSYLELLPKQLATLIESKFSIKEFFKQKDDEGKQEL